jgi:antagonist of KipI
MSIIFKTNGILTTVQDLGRTGFRRFGINPNGAMDKRAVRLINILLGNDENESVLEMYFPAPEIRFERDAIVAVGGADFGAAVDGHPVENWKSVQIIKGQTLKFSRKFSGNIAYMSVIGGFEIKPWLQSTSTNLQAKIGGFLGRKLENNDRLPFHEKKQTARISMKLGQSLVPSFSKEPKIRLIGGEEFGFLTGFSENIFLNENFKISTNSDRMGFRLAGKPLYLLDNFELISAAVDFGTIQLLPDGQMIILMADHQTTGGYPRIGHVISSDLPILAQLGANDKVRFELISINEAEEIALKFERDLTFLRTGLSF